MPERKLIIPINIAYHFKYIINEILQLTYKYAIFNELFKNKNYDKY